MTTTTTDGDPPAGRKRGVASLAELRAAEATIAGIELDKVHLQAVGREALGIVGRREPTPTSGVLGAGRPSWWPAVVLALLSASAVVLPIVVILAVNDEMSGALGGGGPWQSLLMFRLIGAGVAVGSLGIVLPRLPDRVRGASLAGLVSALVAGLLGLVGDGLVGTAWSMTLLSIVGGFAATVVHATVWPLLVDLYPPPARLRAFSVYGAVTMVALAAATALAAVDSAALDLTWRVTFLALGGVTLLASAAALAVRYPGRGRWDGEVADAIHRSLEDHHGGGDPAPMPDRHDLDITSGRIVRGLVTDKTVFALLGLGVAFGVVLVPVFRYLTLLWRDRWDVSANPQLGLFAALCLAGVLGAAWLVWRGEAGFRVSMAVLFERVVLAGCVAGGALALAAVTTSFPVMVVLLVPAFAAFGVLIAAAPVALLTIVPGRERPHASALFVVAIMAGGIMMGPLVQSVGARFGNVWALLVAGFLIMGQCSGLLRRALVIDDETDQVVAELIEAEEMRFLVGRGVHLPLVSCRNIDFSYGPLQVLFGVTLTVDDGEMVALLGTNGAGKSTLLNVISGLGTPTRGSVYLQGRDISYCDTDLRVGMGITQIAGGRAVFGPLTVLDNLRVFAHSHGAKRRAVDEGIERVFEAFPQLVGREHQLASTLSGGERQMLALGKAFILQPKILLIDELSLGLAPVIVGQLLAMVRQINQRGTAVVLVEQSVNVALSLVDHAYFMERGEIRFDGDAADLLDRPDLLRSVFLEGVGAQGGTGSGEPESREPESHQQGGQQP